MKNRYWIKLYIGLLHDHRMAKLDAVTWRHAVELFLLAGETGDDGNVGSLENVAWQLRVEEAEMLACLEKLSSLGIVHEEGDQWVVSNFVERQRPSTSTERVRAFRQRKKSALFKIEVLEEGESLDDEDIPEEEEEVYLFEEGNEIETDETEMKQDETAAAKRFPSASGSASDSYSDSVSESASGNFDKTKFETNNDLPGDIVELSKMLTTEALEVLRPSMMKHPPGWVADAIREAKRCNASSPGYVKAILDRWGVEGRQPKRGSKVLKKPNMMQNPRSRYLEPAYADFIEH